MRMHRGSSKGGRGSTPSPEHLPLSASPALSVTVEFEIARAERSQHRSVTVAVGTPLRNALREIGQAAEGCAVLNGEFSVPLDLPLVGPMRLTVLPTFSGG